MSTIQYRVYLCAGPHCSAAERDQLQRMLEDELWNHHLTESVDIRASGCQNRCEFAPNLTVWPGPYHYSMLTPESIARIVESHLLRGEPVAELLHRRR